jgi:hypothetical protein
MPQQMIVPSEALVASLTRKPSGTAVLDRPLVALQLGPAAESLVTSGLGAYVGQVVALLVMAATELVGFPRLTGRGHRPEFRACVEDLGAFGVWAGIYTTAGGV